MSDFDDIGGPINRPANNSRRATPGEALGAEPSFDADATDFLGLNQSLGAPAPQPSGPMRVPPHAQPTTHAQAMHSQQPPSSAQAPQANAPEDQSWLMEMPGEAHPERAPAPIAAPRVETAEDAGSLLNKTWKETPRPRKSTRWALPLVGVASIAAIALVGYPRLVREPELSSDTTEAVTRAPIVQAPVVVQQSSDVGPAEPEDTQWVEPSVEPGYALTDVVREPEGPSSGPNDRRDESLAVVEQSEVVAREPRTALEEQGLVEVVDPQRARAIRGACDESADSWWTPLDAGVADASEIESALAAEELVALTEPSSETEVETTEVESTPVVADVREEEISSERVPETSNAELEPGVAFVEPTPVGAQRNAEQARLRAERIAARREQHARAEGFVLPSESAPSPESEGGVDVSEPDPIATHVASVDDGVKSPVAEPISTPAVSAVESQPLVPLAETPAPTPNVSPTSASESSNAQMEPKLEAVAKLNNPGMIGAPCPPELQGIAAPPVGPPMPRDLVLAANSPSPSVSSGNERTTQLGIDTVLLLDHVNGVARISPVRSVNPMSFDPVIPFASISSKTKVLTPTVGKVRALLQSGEIFEGVLYAVGEDCLWIDTSVGRMGLIATRVRSVMQIDTPKGAPALGAAGSQNSTGLERVRIKTRGGPLYGKVIERNGDQTTVITDEGARLTVPSADIERLSEVPSVRLQTP